MQRNEILTEAVKRKLFLVPDAMEILESNGYSTEFIIAILDGLSKGNNPFVTAKDVTDFLNGDKALMEPERIVTPRVPKNGDIEVLSGSDISGNSTCTGTIEDFIRFFRSRYDQLKKILMDRVGVATPISSAKTLSRDCYIIGMVSETRTTTNGHLKLTLEDTSGSISVLIHKEGPLKDELFVNDEVVAFKGSCGSKGDMFFPKELIRPDIPQTHQWIKSDSCASVAFLSDIHIGSHEFLVNNWEKMINWLKNDPAANGIGYIVMPGDVVDGIGAYPDQDKDLDIKDIYAQYDTLADYVKQIPDDIKIVMHPGNHDACRLAEPQPALAEMYTKKFDSNVIMTGNPIDLKIEGRTITSYHGKSIDDWISAVRGMSYEDPLAVMKEMCKRRHLAPVYGQRNALAPEKKDYLVMDRVPDIFVSGHVHGAGSMIYRGVRLINASTWQSQTDYQAKHNFNPDPGIMPIVHLGTGHVEMKNFMK